MNNNGRTAIQITSIALAVLIAISGWIYATTKTDAARRVQSVEQKLEKHETRLNMNERGQAVIESQLGEINKKLDTLLNQR